LPKETEKKKLSNALNSFEGKGLTVRKNGRYMEMLLFNSVVGP
jgi:hypothetical protein